MKGEALSSIILSGQRILQKRSTPGQLMLVAKFNCPASEATLKPAAPVPSGKKVKCPECTRVIVVPTPEDEDEEIEEFEEVEPQRERPRKVREEVEEERPSRRRVTRDDDEEVEEERPQKPRKKAKKKARSGGSGLKIALFAVIGLLLAGAGVGVYFLVTKVGSGGASDPRVSALEEAKAILAGVKDQASAQAAKPALVAVGKRLREPYDKAMAALAQDPGAIGRAFEEAKRNPGNARAESARYEREQEAAKKAMDDLIPEAVRVNKVPGGKELLAAFWDSWGDEGKMVGFAVGMTQMMGEGTTPPRKGDIGSVRIGMTEQEVRDIMGNPFTIDTNRPGFRVLSYITGAIDIKDGKVVKKFP